jgi:MFS family permease
MFAVFHKRDFRFLWTGQLVSTIGSSLTDLAAGILIFQRTQSALAVGLMLMATAIPSLIVGLVAGVFVDRFDRKKIMIASDLIRAAIVVSIPFLITIDILLLYVAVICASSVKQFFDPAEQSVLPDVASEEELSAANAFLSISSFGSTAIGFAAAGFLAATGEIALAFYVDAVTFLLSAACIFMVRVAPLVVDETTSIGAVVQNLRAGISMLTGTPILRSTLIVFAPVLFAFGLWNVLLLPFAVETLGGSEFEYGLQEGLTSLGFVAGSLLMAKYIDRLAEGTWMVISFSAMGVVGILYGLSTNIWMAIALVTISGFMQPPSSISRALVLQRNTPREFRGRVFSAFFVSRDVLFLLGMATAGLADVIDGRPQSGDVRSSCCEPRRASLRRPRSGRQSSRTSIGSSPGCRRLPRSTSVAAENSSRRLGSAKSSPGRLSSAKARRETRRTSSSTASSSPARRPRTAAIDRWRRCAPATSSARSRLSPAVVEPPTSWPMRRRR